MKKQLFFHTTKKHRVGAFLLAYLVIFASSGIGEVSALRAPVISSNDCARV